MTKAKFWMVWNPRGHRPTYQHESRKAANDEARRLSLNNPGQEFFVLKAVGGFVSYPVMPTEAEAITLVADDGIPF